MVGVEQWAELRREHFVRGVSIKELVRRTGLSRNTIRVALRAPAPPGYRRVSTAIGFSPVAAIGSPRWWPSVLPGGGHVLSPLVAIGSPRLGSAQVVAEPSP